MPQDNKKTIEKLFHKEQAIKESTKKWAELGLASLFSMAATDIYITAKHLGRGWFKEWMKSHIRWKPEPWEKETAIKLVKNGWFQISALIGIVSGITGLVKYTRVKALREVREAMTPPLSTVIGESNDAHSQWQQKIVAEQDRAPGVSK